jgi:mannitol-specific phosphotransferase system IIBC component
MPNIDPAFTRELLAIGILSYREQETLWNIAQRCARTTGLPLAGMGFVAGASVGSVAVPGVGTVPGAVATALAGLFTGTLVCVGLNLSLRDQLRDFARTATSP